MTKRKQKMTINIKKVKMIKWCGGLLTALCLSVWGSCIGGVGAFYLTVPRGPFSHYPSISLSYPVLSWD